jgi:hypothetical protein
MVLGNHSHAVTWGLPGRQQTVAVTVQPDAQAATRRYPCRDMHHRTNLIAAQSLFQPRQDTAGTVQLAQVSQRAALGLKPAIQALNVRQACIGQYSIVICKHSSSTTAQQMAESIKQPASSSSPDHPEVPHP